MSAPGIIARNLRLIAGNRILGIVDIEITSWRLVFHSCRWRRDETGEQITLGPCNCTEFNDDRVAARIQAAALAAVRTLARKMVTP